MRKISLSLLALFMASTFCAFLVSCGDDDGNGGVQITAEQISGKWIEIKRVWMNAKGNKETSYSDNNRWISFLSNGDGHIQPYNLFEAEICKRTSTFQWHVSNGRISIYENGALNVVFTINRFSDSLLELKWEDEGNTEITTFKRSEE